MIAPANETWTNRALKPYDYDVDRAKDIRKRPAISGMREDG